MNESEKPKRPRGPERPAKWRELADDEDMWFIALTIAIIVTLALLAIVYGIPDFFTP